MNPNPLLQDFEYPPFSKIKPAFFKPAFEEAIRLAQGEIDTIASCSEPPTFENTIEALDYSGEKLHEVSAVFFNLNSAETSPEIQQIAQEVSPWLSKFQNDLMLNERLFKRVKEVYRKQSDLNLNPEQKTLLEQHYKAFVRNGANLSGSEKEELRNIDAELARLSLKFGEHVLADTNQYELHLTDENQLEGLPSAYKETAAALAQEKGKSGYIFTLQAPSYIPFTKYVKDRSLRQRMTVAYGRRGFQKNENNNEETILNIVRLRYRRARLLGFKNHADFVLQERMAKTPEKVKTFLNDLLQQASPAADRQLEELQDFACRKDGIDQLQIWDKSYYMHHLKHRLFDLKDEDLKAYFSLDKVVAGAFKVAGKLYGLHFKEVYDIDKYHQEVKTYEVTDDEGFLKAVFYTDFHPREGKRGGAWMTTFREQKRKGDKNIRPLVSVVCNFSRPGQNQPALLSFEEVTTLFHEFGHALHAVLADTTYPSLSGTNVFWDFVELPSQLLENWCYEQETLSLFARHYRTGEVIPMDLIEKIRKAANFMEGLQTLRQLSFGMLDIAWHTTNPEDIKEVKAFELKTFQATRQFPDIPQNCMSTAFSHIFQGGYAAGYYSYKWAEVLDADAFLYFKEKGIFNRVVADTFKENVLSKGGTEDPALLYRRFRGKNPDNNALLKRAGLTEED